MSTPNPLVPEGSLQQSKGKSNVKIAVFTILAIHAVLLVGLLMQGCKDKPKVASIEPETTAVLTNDTAAIPAMPNPDTGSTAAIPSNDVSAIPAPTPGTAPIPSPVPSPSPSASVAIPAPGVGSEAPVADPGATGSSKEYTIASGDTLGKVAKENHISLKSLLEANPNVSPTKLKIGQKIQIPASTATASATTSDVAPTAEAGKAEGVYVVKAGDMLERIAKSHGTSVKAIKTANNLKTDRLKVGQKLKLPASKTTATAEAAPVAPENPLATTTLTPSATVASGAK